MKLQDGGLTHNNPMKLALEEIETVLHNDPSAKRSTLKVSLGTGKAARHSPEMYGSSSWWRDLWLFRLLRALWSSIEGQENDVRREDTSSSEKESKIGTSRRRGEYFRFSLEFHSRQPRLDDSSKVPEIKTLAQEATIGSEQIDRLAHCLIAELFVFELDSVPRKENGRFSCVGYILCSHRASSQAFRVLLGRLSKSSAKFLIRGRELPGSIQDRLSLARDGNFRKRVCFDVSSRDEFVSLRLQERGSEPYNISGSPFSVDWLIKAQGLELLFGKPDGSKRKRKDNDEGLPKKRQR